MADPSGGLRAKAAEEAALALPPDTLRGARWALMFGNFVIGTGVIEEVRRSGDLHGLRIAVPAAWMKYILHKGFIAIDGSSLTVGETFARGAFDLHLIPETLRLTNLGNKDQGQRVNVELDARTVAIVDTVERVLPQLLAEKRR